MSAMRMDLKQNVVGHDGIPMGWLDALFMENLLKDGWLCCMNEQVGEK